jgi:hypothetical protein
VSPELRPQLSLRGSSATSSFFQRHGERHLDNTDGPPRNELVPHQPSLVKPAVVGCLLSFGHGDFPRVKAQTRKDPELPELPLPRTESSNGSDGSQKPPPSLRLDLILQIIIAIGAIATVIGLVVQLL